MHVSAAGVAPRTACAKAAGSQAEESQAKKTLGRIIRIQRRVTCDDHGEAAFVPNGRAVRLQSDQARVARADDARPIDANR